MNRKRTIQKINRALGIKSKIYNFRLRLSLWIYPKTDCFGCCLTCKYFDGACRGKAVKHCE